MKRKYLVISIFLLVFVYLLISIKTNDVLLIDNIFYNFISNFINDDLTYIIKIITTFGSALVLIPLCIILLFINKRVGIIAGINLSLIFLLNQLLKNIIQRDRPNILRLDKASGYSFPSGHAMVSLAFYGLLIYFIYKFVQNKKIKYSLIILLSILIILIGISRVYLGVHYTSDILAGFILAIIYLELTKDLYLNKLRSNIEYK